VIINDCGLETLKNDNPKSSILVTTQVRRFISPIMIKMLISKGFTSSKVHKSEGLG